MSACRACGASLVWALTDSGKLSPITQQPRPEGNVLLHRGVDGEVHAVVLPREIATYLREQGVLLRISHFADCPDANRFRK